MPDYLFLMHDDVPPGAMARDHTWGPHPEISWVEALSGLACALVNLARYQISACI